MLNRRRRARRDDQADIRGARQGGDGAFELARDLGIPAEHFREFAAGHRDLTDVTLAALAKHFFDADFDPVANRLRSKSTAPATSMGITPPRFDAKMQHYPPPFDPAAPPGRINPGPGLTRPWDGKRPG